MQHNTELLLAVHMLTEELYCCLRVFNSLQAAEHRRSWELPNGDASRSTFSC